MAYTRLKRFFVVGLSVTALFCLLISYASSYPAGFFIPTAVYNNNCQNSQNTISSCSYNPDTGKAVISKTYKTTSPPYYSSYTETQFQFVPDYQSKGKAVFKVMKSTCSQEHASSCKPGPTKVFAICPSNPTVPSSGYTNFSNPAAPVPKNLAWISGLSAGSDCFVYNIQPPSPPPQPKNYLCYTRNTYKQDPVCQSTPVEPQKCVKFSCNIKPCPSAKGNFKKYSTGLCKGLIPYTILKKTDTFSVHVTDYTKKSIKSAIGSTCPNYPDPSQFSNCLGQ